AALPLSYVGSDRQVSIAIDEDGRLQGEALGVFGFNGRRAFVAEGWFGAGAAGGLKAGYHWLDDSAGRNARVFKLLLAADQNHAGDRKATLGFALEREAGELAMTWARGITGSRLANAVQDRHTQTVAGQMDGRPYQQVVTTDTPTELFERPYEQSIGVRFGKFHEPGLLRLRGGLDYDRGLRMANGDHAGQGTASIGLEKHFRGSPYSVGIDLELARKHGDPGNDRNDARVAVRWRYALDGGFRATGVAAAPPMAPTPERMVVRNEVAISGSASFRINDATLDDAAVAELARLVDTLKRSLSGTVEIVGHTCDLGDDNYNAALS